MGMDGVLDAFIDDRMQDARIPGLAMALTDRERTLRVATFGFANLDARAPVRPETLFAFGSIGKSFTSIALLQEAEAGRVDLDAPVTAYLPWFSVRSPYAPISLRHLLSHTAGITSGADFSPDSRAEVYALRHAEVGAPPDAHFHYSNAGYKTLGLVLERLTGRAYAEIITQRILDPLGMVDTVATITNEARSRMAVGYLPFYDDRPMPPDRPLAPAPWLETATADGCLAATAGDLATYLRMLLNRGAGPRGPLLAEGTFAQLIAPRIAAWEGRSYGLGLATWTEAGHTVIGHGGSMPGYHSSICGDLDAGLGAVVLINGPGDPQAIADAALAALRADRTGSAPPTLAGPRDRTEVADAARYAGVYTSGTRRFVVVVEQGRLVLADGEVRVPLEPRQRDHFYANHPAYARYLLRFARQGEAVVEAFHGPDWYPNERYAGPAAPTYPPEWAAYPGHYRAHNPWLSNFRVVLRKGSLALIYPGGTETPLVPRDDGTFRLGEEAHNPEMIRFADIVECQALRATLSLGSYFRFFTP